MRFLAIHDTTLASYLTGLVSKHLHAAPSGRAFIGAGRRQGKSYHAVIHVVSALAKDVVGSSCIKVRQWNSRTVEGIKENRGMFPRQETSYYYRLGLRSPFRLPVLLSRQPKQTSTAPGAITKRLHSQD